MKKRYESSRRLPPRPQSSEQEPTTSCSNETILKFSSYKTKNNHGGLKRRRGSLHQSILSEMKNSILLSVCVFVSVASMVVSRRWSFFATMRGDSNSPQQYYRQQETMYDVQHSFPVSPHDFEEIDHPAAVYLQSSYPEGLSKTLSVPRFWNPPAYGGDIRQYLGGGKGLMSKEKALTVGSFVEEKETIYLTIASYRDSDCINTVQSAFSVAAYPERLRIVVIEQIREGDTVCTIPTEPSCQEDPDQVLCKYSHLIESFEMDARLAVGPTFARHIGHRYYRGEYFVLQVDAHVRFVRDWDESIINQWKLANNEMAVLTNYMLDLNGAIDENGNSRKKGKSLICNSDFEGDYLRHGQQPPRPSSSSDDPVLSPFWAAGFSFARGHFVVQVPYDAYLTNVFQGEEYNLGLRGFTYGYDYYAPEHSVCFHMYAVHKNSENRLAVPRFSENKSVFGKHLVNELANEGTKRLSGILQVNGESATYNRIEEEKYGIGHVRTTDKFFRTFGIHPETRTVENHLCWFVGDHMQRILLPALRSDGMGIDYDLIDYEFKDPAPDQP